MSSTVRRWWPEADPRVIDAVAAVVLLGLLLVSFGVPVRAEQRPIDLGAWVLAAGLCLPFAVHRRLPWAALATTLAALLAFALLHYAPYPGISIFALVFALALHGSRRVSLGAFGLVVAGLLAALIAQPPTVTETSDWVSTLLGATVAFLAGANLRQRRARWAVVEERAALLERERDERDRAAVVAERLRIARELHDVVAHSMSVIAVQSGVGHHIIDTDLTGAKNALAVIEATSRNSLTEIRRLLGVLRDGNESASVTPAPGLNDLSDLVARTRRTGLGVTLDSPIDGPADLPSGVALTAYRIVQEALTNVIKHGGPIAYVRVACRPGEVSLDITDEGRRDASGDGALGSGQGIIGMRERVAVYDGEFVAGARPGGGFRVSATLPYAGESS